VTKRKFSSSSTLTELIMVGGRNVTDADRSACPSCGSPLPESSRFCPRCGRELSTISPGQIFDGKYEILKKLAEGGMGEVFTARHIHLDEVRIIKVMKAAALGDGTEQHRFTEEARLATVVRHPNVAALYDFARLPSGSYYMVWEYIDGETLLQKLHRQGRLDFAEALEISTQVLAGLSAIHRAGIVHRDISPDNIMVTSSGPGRTVKIIDLGIAKRTTGANPGMTATGIFLGKLKYCSPEQAGALGSGATIDARSDIYSWGAVLYEMLTGKPLFESPTPEGYLAKHLREPPPRLPVAGLPATVAPGLSGAIARALEKDRAKRFASAAEFSAALEALRKARRPAPAATAPTTMMPSRRKSLGLWLAASFALAIGLTAIGYSWWRTRKTEPVEPPKTEPSAALAATPAPATSAPALPTSPTVAVTEASTTVPPPASRPKEGPKAPAPPTNPPLDETAAAERLALLRSAARSGKPEAVQELLEFLNGYVAEHPDSRLSMRIQRETPTWVKTAAEFHEQHGHPFRAMRLYEFYERLTFAPQDPEVEERLASLRAKTRMHPNVRKESPDEN
jgi:serine/threonine-protein kinase